MTTKAQQQQLRTLRRAINRAVTALRDGDSVWLNAGRRSGEVFRHPWLNPGENSSPPEDLERLHLLFPGPTDEQPEFPWTTYSQYYPKSLEPVLNFFWPGPFALQVAVPKRAGRLCLSCPRHPLLAELLSRHGPLFWRPMDTIEKNGRGPAGHVLHWEEPHYSIPETVMDVGSRPWRFTKIGYLSPDELLSKAEEPEPTILSEDRASPRRKVRTFRPAHRTVILEVAMADQLSSLWEKIRGAIGQEVALRLYVDAATAHEHYPDHPAVKVFGELEHPERVRRRLEAMLERQKQLGGKRLMVVAVPPITDAFEALKSDLLTLSPFWFKLTTLGDFDFSEIWTKTSSS